MLDDPDEVEPDEVETPLMPGENPDIWTDALDVAGEQWLYTSNTNLGGNSPATMIDNGHVDLVRDLLRLIRFAGAS